MSGLLRAWEPRILSIVRLIVGLLFMEHGTAKLLGFPPGTIAPVMFSLLWFAGVIEMLGGACIAVGLYTRSTAFLSSGEMAVGYFHSHAPHDFFPVLNRGDAAILFCFIFLYFAVAGGGSWSLDRLLGRDRARPA